MHIFTDWENEIAEVSELPEYQNATISILDPSLISKTYSYESNSYTVSGDAVVYSGQARIQPNRSATVTSTPVGDISAAKYFIVQIPSAEFVEIKKGFQVQVTDAGRNPRLLGYLFTVLADADSSHMASHTFECVVNVEQNPQWGD